jgi:uncharacterized protein
MSKRIPERLDPWRYADLGKTISGAIRLDSLPRLGPCLLAAEGDVSFDLRFERDAQRRAILTGSLSADLVLECQRCLAAVTLPVKANLALAFVEGMDQAGQLPDRLDPCLVEDGGVSFRDLIEDELLLALPQVAMHAAGACPNLAAGRSDDKPVTAEGRSGDNPFAVLAELKRDK